MVDVVIAVPRIWSDGCFVISNNEEDAAAAGDDDTNIL